MDEANLQEMIYYIKNFKSIGCTCTHADIELSKVHAMYHQWEMEKNHNNPDVAPTVNPRDCTNTLETVEEYIRVFCGVYRQPLSYGLRDDLVAPVAAYDPMYRANGD